MGDERVEDEMIEIGDPSDETIATEPPPRLVIEYRERGVPWMLIPPMVVLSAVAAVMVYSKLSPPPRPVPVSASASSEPIGVGPAVATEPPGNPSPTIPGPSTGIEPEVKSPGVPASPFELTTETPSVASPSPAPADVPAVAAAPQETPETAPFPRVQGLGFDPKGLEDPAPPVDQAVATTAGPQERRDQPAREPVPAIDPDVRALPEVVDPDVLPVDPREAKARRARRLAEARLKIEADRGKFHAELRAICRRSAEKAGPQIEALCATYGTELDPKIKQDAKRLLNGPAAGVDRPVRINMLRSLGFSESLILIDISEVLLAHEDGTSRGGARSKDEITYQSAKLLLSYPPTRVATPPRPLSTTRAAR
jgi:hypothetical protein